MGRKYADSHRTAHTPAAVWAVLPAVLANCGFEVTETSDDHHILKATKSIKNVTVKSLQVGSFGKPARGNRSAKATWGEKLEASITPDGDGSSIHLESRLKFGLLDWGENRRNVEAIRAELASALASPS